MILAGDVGGTKVWLRLARAATRNPVVVFERKYPSAGYTGLESLLTRFIAEFRAAGGGNAPIDSACFGIAGPVSGTRASVTNLPWQVDAAEIRAAFGIGAVSLVNDFEAAAHGLDALGQDGLRTLQQGDPAPGGNRVLVGAGTGFGLAYLTWCGSCYRVIAGEGGHMGFSPADERQAALWQDIRAREGRVSVEHVVSGPGLTRIHSFLRRGATGGARSTSPETQGAVAASPETIVQTALTGRSSLALDAVDVFAACYGAAAGDHALAVLARGGVYLAGGIAPAILPRLLAGGFLRSFRDKGVHAELMSRIPVHVVTEQRLGLIGAARLAEQAC